MNNAQTKKSPDTIQKTWDWFSVFLLVLFAMFLSFMITVHIAGKSHQKGVDLAIENIHLSLGDNMAGYGSMITSMSGECVANRRVEANFNSWRLFLGKSPSDFSHDGYKDGMQCHKITTDNLSVLQGQHLLAIQSSIDMVNNQ